jgi:hypothetical protein
MEGASEFGSCPVHRVGLGHLHQTNHQRHSGGLQNPSFDSVAPQKYEYPPPYIASLSIPPYPPYLPVCTCDPSNIPDRRDRELLRSISEQQDHSNNNANLHYHVVHDTVRECGRHKRRKVSEVRDEKDQYENEDKSKEEEVEGCRTLLGRSSRQTYLVTGRPDKHHLPLRKNRKSSEIRRNPNDSASYGDGHFPSLKWERIRRKPPRLQVPRVRGLLGLQLPKSERKVSRRRYLTEMRVCVPDMAKQSDWRKKGRLSNRILLAVLSKCLTDEPQLAGYIQDRPQTEDHAARELERYLQAPKKSKKEKSRERMRKYLKVRPDREKSREVENERYRRYFERSGLALEIKGCGNSRYNGAGQGLRTEEHEEKKVRGPGYDSRGPKKEMPVGTALDAALAKVRGFSMRTLTEASLDALHSEFRARNVRN